MEHMATQSSVLLRQSRDPAAAWTEYRVFRPHGAVTEDSILLMAKDDMTVLIEIKILGPGNGNGDD
jgi:hypothetical protein